MNIPAFTHSLDNWMSLVHGYWSRDLYRSKYQPKPAPAPGPGTKTRQRERAAIYRATSATVNKANPGMPRHERRNLARAYAVQVWKQRKPLAAKA